jgi:hypothetical protein
VVSYTALRLCYGDSMGGREIEGELGRGRGKLEPSSLFLAIGNFHIGQIWLLGGGDWSHSIWRSESGNGVGVEWGWFPESLNQLLASSSLLHLPTLRCMASGAALLVNLRLIGLPSPACLPACLPCGWKAEPSGGWTKHRSNVQGEKAEGGWLDVFLDLCQLVERE